MYFNSQYTQVKPEIIRLVSGKPDFTDFYVLEIGHFKIPSSRVIWILK